MAVDSNLSFLLRNLKVDDPWIPPKTWESIPSESGMTQSSNPAQKFQDSIDDLSAISESKLVRLSLYALQGVKSSIVHIDRLSVTYCSIPADRTFHNVPNLWSRSLSTSALGGMLKSISHSGLVFLFLSEFVNFYLNSPCSLVNQAFSVAVGKFLEGYVSALNTLLASVKLRRFLKNDNGEGVLRSVVNSDITILEVYLHTEELRTHIEALGNICLTKFADLSSLKESLTAGVILEFHEFPRGADLLTYLYVLLRDADPGHHALLKFLFVQSCEPYCAFIKSWIYHAKIDDPYGEFFLVHTSAGSNVITGSVDDLSLASIKERDCTSVPCFLKDACRPLIRAGQQLEVLVKLLSMCNFSLIKEYQSCTLENLEDILPFWIRTPSNPAYLSNQLTFSRKGIQILLHKRETMYKAVMEKLQKFFAILDIRYEKMQYTAIPLFGRRISPFSLISDGDLNNASITNEKEAIHVVVGLGDSDASTSYESLIDMESSQSSERSSTCSYEDEDDRGAFTELPDISHQSSEFLFSNLRTCYARKSALQNAETEKIHSLKDCFHSDCKTMDSFNPLALQDHENVNWNLQNENLNQTYATLKFDVTNREKLLLTCGEGNLFIRCWPLGTLLKNPFYCYMNHKVPVQKQFAEFCQQNPDGRREILEHDATDFGEMFVRFPSKFDTSRKTQIKNDADETISSSIQQSWNSCDCYDLSVNPMLTKTVWLRTVRNVRERDFVHNDGPCLTHFNFSSVLDPFKDYSESTISSQGYESRGKAPKIFVSASPVTGVSENSDNSLQQNKTSRPLVSSVCSSRETNDMSDVLPPNASGGSGWEGLLNYSGEDASFCDVDEWCASEGTFEAPLDVIIDKCIVQEIMTQYKYVSNFAIKLLKEGFDLHEHLVALRRYHFMEQADWADSFIMSLRHQKLSVTEPEQKIAKIQGLLRLALQRSSCGNDPYKERLFVCAKGQSMISKPTSATGFHAFDSLVLGYRVDWPVNIIITQDSLRTYADVFNYLIQVRLAVLSLTDVWHWLKSKYDGVHDANENSNYLGYAFCLNMILFLMPRPVFIAMQQINHFVHTLQEYVHSHLSDVSWCRFQHSLQHHVKDMLDLESVHASYLADALHICFLSDETKPVAVIIKNILQCALDFRLCFHDSGLVDVRSDGNDPLQINISQVLAIKTAFERNIKDLYVLYQKSPKHGEFNLFRFWSHLNYNDYYITIAQEMGCFYH